MEKYHLEKDRTFYRSNWWVWNASDEAHQKVIPNSNLANEFEYAKIGVGFLEAASGFLTSGRFNSRRRERCWVDWDSWKVIGFNFEGIKWSLLLFGEHAEVPL